MGVARSLEPPPAHGERDSRRGGGSALTAATDFEVSLEALVDAGVEFVVVGVSGINFYARTPADAVSTLDVDLLLGPRVDNLRAAFATLGELGYRFEAGGEPFLDVNDHRSLEQIIRRGARVVAAHDSAGELDLMLSIAGTSFEELRSDAQRFRISGCEILVGKLERLLRSKEIAGRPKDIEFLRAFAARATEDED